MKIVVFGDIHGNIDALRAANDAAVQAKDLPSRRSGRVRTLRERGCRSSCRARHLGVQGNDDDAVADDREHCGCKSEEPLQEEMARRAAAARFGR